MFGLKLLGKVFIVRTQEVGIGGIVVCDQDGVVCDTDVAIQRLEEAAGEMTGLPR